MLKMDRRVFSMLLLVLASAGILSACQAALETKRGGFGEFCNNRDTDCRDGLICEDSVCVYENPQAGTSCENICRKLETCAIEQGNCLADCGQTIQNWGESQISDFEMCIVDEQTCGDLGDSADAAAQTCYDELSLPVEREERCQRFINKVAECDSSINTQTLRSECIFAAKTVDEDTWSNTDSCIDAVEFGTCDEVYSCLNSVFLPNDESAPIER
jgi:hypothetical protein